MRTTPTSPQLIEVCLLLGIGTVTGYLVGLAMRGSYPTWAAMLVAMFVGPAIALLFPFVLSAVKRADLRTRRTAQD
jgi:hypothetical protein